LRISKSSCTSKGCQKLRPLILDELMTVFLPFFNEKEFLAKSTTIHETNEQQTRRLCLFVNNRARFEGKCFYAHALGNSPFSCSKIPFDPDTIQIRSQNLANRPWTQIDLSTFKTTVFMNWIRIQIELNPHENVVYVGNCKL
jgi:hypothetical protein